MFYKRISTISIISILFLSLTSFIQAQGWIRLISNETTLSAPTARSQHSAVYDSVNSRMIIFGGIPGVNDLNDVWVLSNANGLGGTPSWTQLTTTIRTPEARNSHTAVYDAINNRMTIYGGSNDQGSLFSDVWVLSNANGLDTTIPTWTEVYPPSDSSPGLRAGHTAVYDTTHNQMIIFGGGAINNYNDVWVLSNTNGLDSTTPVWTQLTTTGSTPTTRSSHTAVYDANNNRMTIFGGYNAGTFLNDVWVLSNANGLSGTPTWTQLFPTGSIPTTRYGHTAVYDATNNRMTIFGGYIAGTFLNDTWVLSNANGQGGMPVWTQLLPPGGTPTVRDGHSAIYDSASNRMTIFGGGNSTNYLNDAWILINSDYITSVPKEIWELLDE